MAVMMLLISSCTPELDSLDFDESILTTQKEATITSISKDRIAITFSPERSTAEIALSANRSWTAEIINSKADSWCSVSTTSGSKGNAIITISVNENNTYEERNASIVFKCGELTKTIVVTQKQNNAVLLSSNKVEISPDAQEIILEIKHNITFTYEISEDCKGWVYKTTSKGMTSDRLTFFVSANEDLYPREGTITVLSSVGNEVVKIYQLGAKPVIILSEPEIVIDSEGTTFKVEISSNVNVDCCIESGNDWISEISTKAISTNTFYFHAKSNETYEQRTGKIVFTNMENNLKETVLVEQMQKDAIVIAKSSYDVSEEGGTISITLGHNVDYDCNINVNWITQVQTKTFVEDNLLFEVQEYSSYGLREGTITFISTDKKIVQTVTICQVGHKLEYKDGDVVVLQESNFATGPDIVLLGDGFTEKDIMYGTYDAVMRQTYKNIFDVEPYNTLKDGFNVYYVNAVSPEHFDATITENGAINGNATTKFSVRFSKNDTHMEGDKTTVYDYARLALEDIDKRMHNATIVVIANLKTHAGTCHISIYRSDYGMGPSIAYCSLGRNESDRVKLIHHEVCGHGIGKLADEYFTGLGLDLYSLERKVNNLMLYHEMGLYRNADIDLDEDTRNEFQGDYKATDKNNVYWHDLFGTTNNYESDSVEALGLFKGGYGLMAFFCRPTEDSEKSIMINGTDRFNAISRRQIYYRYLRLSGIVNTDEYGTPQELNRFLQWDAENILPKIKNQTSISSTPKPPVKDDGFLPLHAPILHIMDEVSPNPNQKHHIMLQK